MRTPFGWSPDGRQLLHNCLAPARYAALCVSPRDATSPWQVRQVLIDDAHDLWQGQSLPTAAGSRSSRRTSPAPIPR